MEIPPLKTFIIYARADMNFKDALRRQLRPLEQMQLLEVWDDSHLLPGEEWEKSIEEKLDESHLVLMLVSEASLFSDFIQKKELKTTLERKRQGVTQFIPILVRDCLWEVLPDFKTVQMLPLDDKRNILAVDAWISQSSAWAAALRELHRLVPDIQQKIITEIKAREESERAEAEARRQKEEADKVENLRYKRDEAAWKNALAEVVAANSIEEKLEIYQTYLEDHNNHQDEAEVSIHELQAKKEMARKLAEKRERHKRQGKEEQQRENYEDVDPTALQKLPELSPIEKRILCMTVKGMISKQIAEEIKMSQPNVEKHRRNIMHKLGVTNAITLGAAAIKYGVCKDVK